MSQGTLAQGLNDSGLVIGYVVTGAGSRISFTRNGADSFTMFNAPNAGTAASTGTAANAVNNSGTSTGSYTDAEAKTHGFIRF